MSLPIVSRKRRPVSFWALSLIPMILPAFALADDAQKPLIPQAELCPVPPRGEGVTVLPQALVAWLLGQNLVRDRALDTDGDGNTLAAEKIRAMTDETYCASHPDTCSAADEKALAKAREELRAFVAAAGGPGYVIERVDAAGRASPLADDGPAPEAILDEGDPTVRIRCVAIAETPEDADGGQKPYWHSNEKRPGGFRLVGDIDNLSKSRGSLGAVKAAQLSITSDLIEDETAYRINAVAGYAFEIEGGDDLQTTFIPFLEAERVTSGDETQIDTLGAGFQQAATVEWPGPLHSEFAVTPVYRTDSDVESRTGTLKFRWTPTFAGGTGFPLGHPEVYGPIELAFGLDLLADVGRVFDEGDQGNLDGEGNFFRIGNQASLQIRGAPGGYLRPFEVQLANRYLYNVDANLDGINQFDAALAYLFPGNEHYQLSFAYSNGRDENSLELYEFWQTQFGIRFKWYDHFMRFEPQSKNAPGVRRVCPSLSGCSWTQA